MTAMTKRRVEYVFDGLAPVGHGGNDGGIFPAGFSGQIDLRAACFKMVMPVWVPPVKMMKSTSGWSVNVAPAVALLQGRNCNTFLETPALQNA